MNAASQLTSTIDISVDISWTGDLPATYTNRPTRREVPLDLRSIAGIERPAFERYDLDPSRVEARVWKKAKGPPSVGRVTNASVTGMWIEGADNYPLRTEVTVELMVPGGYSATLAGRVVRRNDDGMAIHLTTDDSTWHFRSSFLELAKSKSGEAPVVVVRKGDTAAPDGDLAGDMRVLGGKWHEVLADLEDDDVHQEFIQECIRRQRLEFGLERYRELRGGPDDEVASKYLGQIGTILGFMSLKKKDETDDPARGKLLKVILLVLALVCALVAARSVLMEKLTPADAPAISAPEEGATSLLEPASSRRDL